ncbi:MAG: hypothetical protein EBU90_01530 [Proteobacteria bacterium]|nr:hypothetical protein [Pseudomonadota bacterium]
MKVNSFKSSESNFWEFNPSFQYLTVFSAIRKEDTSSLKKDSSYYMWFAWFMYDAESPYNYFPEKERIKSVAECVFFKKFQDGEENIVTKDSKGWLNKILQEYQKVTMTAAQRSLALFDETLREREEYIRTLVYSNPNDAKLKDELLINTKKVLDSRKEIEKLANLDSSSVEINNSEASLSDSRVI